MSTIPGKQVKTARCNRCFHEVSWDKSAREKLNTTRPVTPDKQFIHECPVDGNGNLIVAAGFEQQAKEAYDKYIASKDSGASTTSTPSTPSTSIAPSNVTQNQNVDPNQNRPDHQAAISAIMNSTNPESQGIRVALAEVLNKMEKLMQEQEDWKNKVVNEIYAMDQTVQKLDKVVGEFIRYNPMEYTLRGFMGEIMPHVDWRKFSEKSAMDKLENQKDDPTLAQQELEEQPGEDPQ